MGNTKQRAPKRDTKRATKREWVHKPRVASFKKSDKKAGYLTPVNARAQRLTTKLGKRLYVTPAQLEPYQGYYAIKVYTANGVRRTLKV